MMQQYESKSICQLTGSCIMELIDRSPCEQQTQSTVRWDADASFFTAGANVVKRSKEGGDRRVTGRWRCSEGTIKIKGKGGFF